MRGHHSQLPSSFSPGCLQNCDANNWHPGSPSQPPSEDPASTSQLLSDLGIIYGTYKNRSVLQFFVHLPILYIHFLHFKCINSFKCFYSLNAYLLLPISDQHRNNRTIKFKQIKGKSHALLPFLFPFYLSLLWFPVQPPISGRHTFSIYWFVMPPETQMRSK